MQTSGAMRREIANVCFRRMGGAKRYPSMTVRVAMGIASLHPSYRTETLMERSAATPRVLGRCYASPIEP